MQLVAGVRIAVPTYFRYGDSIIANLNFDRYFELSPYWAVVLIPWDIILAVSGIRAIMKNNREQLFEVSQSIGFQTQEFLGAN